MHAGVEVGPTPCSGRSHRCVCGLALPAHSIRLSLPLPCPFIVVSHSCSLSSSKPSSPCVTFPIPFPSQDMHPPLCHVFITMFVQSHCLRQSTTEAFAATRDQTTEAQQQPTSRTASHCMAARHTILPRRLSEAPSCQPRRSRTSAAPSRSWVVCSCSVAGHSGSWRSESPIWLAVGRPSRAPTIDSVDRTACGALKHCSCMQEALAFSSPDAELHALNRSVVTEFGIEWRIVLHTDASAVGIMRRRRAGTLKHFAVQEFWLHGVVQDGRVELRKVWRQGRGHFRGHCWVPRLSGPKFGARCQ